MSATRSRIRKCLCLTLYCALTILFLHYITQLDGLAIRDFMQNKTSVNLGFIRASKAIRQSTDCKAKLENAKHFLNLTSILAYLNRPDDQIPYLMSGGRYKPSTCEAKHRVAVIVPYRDRETHLKIFLKYMHPFLQRQQLEYGIFVVESIPGVKINRGLLLNIGYTEAKKFHDYNCFVFHDVDLLPGSDVTDYTCEQSPLHLASAIDVEKYRLPYKSLCDGVCAFKKDHFETINGFSNLYFDWGGEDDDIHERDLLWKSMRKRQRHDGLTSLNYRLIKQEIKRLYTLILVSVNETQNLELEPIHKEAFTTTTKLPTTKLSSETRSYTSKKQIFKSDAIHKEAVTSKLPTTKLSSETSSYTSKMQILESEAIHKEAVTSKLPTTKLSSETSSYTPKKQILESEAIHKEAVTTKLPNNKLSNETNSYTPKKPILESEDNHKEAVTTKLPTTKPSVETSSYTSKKQILESEAIHKEGVITKLPPTKHPSEANSFTTKTQIIESEPIHKEAVTTKLPTIKLPSETSSKTPMTQILESEAIRKEVVITIPPPTKRPSKINSYISTTKILAREAIHKEAVITNHLTTTLPMKTSSFTLKTLSLESEAIHKEAVATKLPTTKLPSEISSHIPTTHILESEDIHKEVVTTKRPTTKHHSISTSNISKGKSSDT